MKTTFSPMAIIGLLLLAGCSREISTTPAGSWKDGAPPVDGTKYLLTSEPLGAKEILQARQSVQDGDPLVIAGRIGGSISPWVEGRGAFSIVDRSLDSCSDIACDYCPRPWDYCCVPGNLSAATALVKLVDDDGQLVRADARELLHVKELDTLIVKGNAQRDESGNLTVLAHGVYVMTTE